MEQPVEELHRTMQHTLTKNMLFFKKQFPYLWEKYHRYKPKQAALGLDEQGRLNLMTAKGALYALTADNPDLTSVCHKQVTDYFKRPFSIVFRLQAEKLVGDYFKHMTFMRKIVELGDDCFERSQESYEPLEVYHKIPCLFVFGVGVGLHLNSISQRSQDIEKLVIYEPNLDIFYASMHLVDYESICKEFIKKNKRFSLFVGIDKKKLLYSFYHFIYKSGSYSSAILYMFKHCNEPYVNDAFNFINNSISLVKNGFGFFEDEIISARNYHENSCLNKKFLSSKVKQPINIPVFICANGPSMDDSIEYIKENRDKAFVISCGTVLSVLARHNIYPDIHIEIERTEIVPKYLKLWDPEGDYLKNVDLICNNTLSINAIKMFKTATFFLKPNDFSSEVIMGVTNEGYKKMLYLFFSNPTVFNAGLALAMHYQAKEIYCFGVDLGFKDESYHHSKDSVYYTVEKGDYLIDDCSIVVEGNFGGKVKTDAIYNWSKKMAEELIHKYKMDDCKIYNTSQGALISGIEPLQIKEIPDLQDCQYFDRNWIKNNTSSEIVSGAEYRKRSKKCLLKSIELLDFFSNPSYLDLSFDDSNILDFLDKNHRQIKMLEGRAFYHPVIRMTEGSILYVNSVILGYMKTIERRKYRNEFLQKVVELYVDYFKSMKAVAKDFLQEIKDKNK